MRWAIVQTFNSGFLRLFPSQLAGKNYRRIKERRGKKRKTTHRTGNVRCVSLFFSHRNEGRTMTMQTDVRKLVPRFGLNQLYLREQREKTTRGSKRDAQGPLFIYH